MTNSLPEGEVVIPRIFLPDARSSRMRRLTSSSSVSTHAFDRRALTSYDFSSDKIVQDFQRRYFSFVDKRKVHPSNGLFPDSQWGVNE
jgi:hypothetical protein